MTLDRLRIGCGDLDYAMQAYDAGLISQEQLAMDSKVYLKRRERPKYDARFTTAGRRALP